MNHKKQIPLILFFIAIFSWGFLQGLFSEEQSILPQIPKPDSESNKRFYYEMKMRRYHRLYSETRPQNAKESQRTYQTQVPRGPETAQPPSGKKRKAFYLPFFADNTEQPPKTPLPPPASKSRPSMQSRANADAGKKAPKTRALYSRESLPRIDGKSLLKKTRAIPGFSRLSLSPLPKGPYRYYSPRFYKGIYLNNAVPRSSRRYKRLLDLAKKHGVNTLVVDVQPRIPSRAFIRLARESGFYLVARIVVYHGGLNHYPPSKKYIHRIAELSKKAAKVGFMEVQLDYIRFSDYYKGPALSWRQRYRTVATILKYVSQKLRPLGVPLGADIFGRIPFNRHDRIGQNMEVFALYLDTIYPMLYPSHFYGDKEMQSKPYLPVFHGVRKSIQRVGKQSRIIAYIQAFRMHTKKSRLSYTNYIYRQLKAAKDAGGAGFVAWNAGSSYKAFFKALDKFHKQNTTGTKLAGIEKR